MQGNIILLYLKQEEVTAKHVINRQALTLIWAAYGDIFVS